MGDKWSTVLWSALSQQGTCAIVADKTNWATVTKRNNTITKKSCLALLQKKNPFATKETMAIPNMYRGSISVVKNARG